MVTLFPELLNYSFYAPFLIRVVLGMFALYYGFSKFKNTAESAETSASFDLNYLLRGIIIIAGALVFIGLFTQLAALVLAVIFLILLFSKNYISKYQVNEAELILLTTMAISMMLLPAGRIAFDLPL
jgi:uncharacterized membrane protein YphA (DoxX/SURF4 family)